MQRQRPGHRILSFHHRGLLLLAAAVAVMLFFLYGCMAGAVYSPRGRLVFIPLAQVSGSRTTSLFPLLSGRIGAAHRMVQCAGRYEKQARSPAEPRHPQAHDGQGAGRRFLRCAGTAGAGRHHGLMEAAGVEQTSVFEAAEH